MRHERVIYNATCAFAIAFSLSILIDYLYLKPRHIDTKKDVSKGGLHECRFDPAGVIFVAILYGIGASVLTIGYIEMSDPSITRTDIYEFKQRMGI